MPWVAEAIALKQEQQLHPFTGSEAPPGGRALWVRFSGVVSARPFYEIPRIRPHVLCGFWVDCLVVLCCIFVECSEQKSAFLNTYYVN